MTKQNMTMGESSLSKMLVDIVREAGVAQDFSSAGNESAPPKRLSAAQAAAVAGKQLTELVRLPLDSVSSVTRSESGWQVTVTLVELSRIPHSTDVIASYSVTLSKDGDIDSYRRITRYTRDQLGDDL